MYSIIKTDSKYKTYHDQYGWTVSAAFIKGDVSAIILIVIWLAVISIALYYITEKFQDSEDPSSSSSRRIPLRTWALFFLLVLSISIVNGNYIIIIIIVITIILIIIII